MRATEYFYKMMTRVTAAVDKSAQEQIKDRTFWKDDKDTYIGVLDWDSTINSQDRELEKLGGVLKKAGTYYATWHPPKASQLYQLSFWGHGGRHGLYYLLYLKDGREFLLKLTARRISLVDHLSPFAYRQLMTEFFLKLYGEGSSAEKTIKKMAITGGYK